MICTIIYLIIVTLIALFLFSIDEAETGIGFSAAAVVIACALLLPVAFGGHYDGNKELVNERIYIMDAMKSEDLELREQAVQRAIEYNDKVASGKQALANPWINWFVDRIWRDAELIPLDYSTVTIKEDYN